MATDTAALPPPIPARTLPVWRQVLLLGWPGLVQQLLVLIVMLYDAWLGGRSAPASGDHVAAQSAQTTAMYLGWLISSYALLVSVGSTALVARFVGAGDHASAVHVTNQSLLLAGIIGLAGSVAGLVWVEELVALLQLEGDAAIFAVDYLRPLFAVLVFPMLGAAGIACLVGAGDTRTGLYVLAGVAVVNVPLASLFRHGWGPIPSLDFAGIAVGTAVSQVLGGLAVLVILAVGRAGLRLRLGQLRPDPGLIRRLMRISLPAGADSLLTASAQLCFLGIVNDLGATASGAHGIALRWEALAFLAGSAFGTAAMALVGQSLGAGEPDRAARSGWSAFGLCCGVMCFCGLVFVVCAPWMFELFCPHEWQRGEIEVGTPVLRLIAVAMPPLAATIVFTASLRGAGDTLVPVLFTLTGFFAIRLPLAWWLTKHTDLGLTGAWLAMIADVFARGFFVLWRFASGRWRGIVV